MFRQLYYQVKLYQNIKQNKTNKNYGKSSKAKNKRYLN